MLVPIKTGYPYYIRMDFDVDKDSGSGICYPHGYNMDTICYLISADMPQFKHRLLRGPRSPHHATTTATVVLPD